MSNEIVVVSPGIFDYTSELPNWIGFFPCSLWFIWGASNHNFLQETKLKRRAFWALDALIIILQAPRIFLNQLSFTKMIFFGFGITIKETWFLWCIYAPSTSFKIIKIVGKSCTVLFCHLRLSDDVTLRCHAMPPIFSFAREISCILP